MQNLSLKELESALQQIEKYNKDFNYYFGCLTTVNYAIEETTIGVKKVTNIDLNKRRSDRALTHIANLIRRARFTNKYIAVSLGEEIENLKNILKYLDEKRPEFRDLALKTYYPNGQDEKTFMATNANKVIVNIKKLNNNISVAKNYILPKNEALLLKRNAVQDRLELKFNNLPNDLAKDAEYDAKF